jgi:AraC-like DNA-binding protein
MKIHIRNMVCNRCISVVRNELDSLHIPVTHIALGEADLGKELSTAETEALRKRLEHHGFELLDDQKSKLIEQIKTVVINLVHYSEEKIKVNLSDYIAEKVGRDYDYLSSLFSEVEGLTIEKYMILQRIERVKELLVYGELSLSEIAWKTGYSSLAHLSAQFKKVTGLTPSHYREVRDHKRKPLDQL